MKALIEDIKKALKAEAYISALSLALVLPDICGQIASPELKVGERYKKWYDTYVTQDNYPTDFENKLKFDGAKCYQLRCALLHSGNIDGVEEKTSLDEFSLCVSRPISDGVYGGSRYSINRTNEDKEKYSVRIEINQLCFYICSAAEWFQNNYDVFAKYSPTIIDLDKELAKLNELSKVPYATQ